MSIRFNCPECGEPFDVPDAAAGMKGKCKCGALIDVPLESVVPKPPPLSGESDPPAEPEPDVVPFEPPDDSADKGDLQPDVTPLGPEAALPPDVAVVDYDSSLEGDAVVEVVADSDEVEADRPATESVAAVRAGPPPPPVAVATPVVPPVTQPPAVSAPRERKYRQLRAYGRMLRLSAVVAIVLAALNAAILVWTSRAAFQLGDPIAIAAVLVFAAGIAVAGAVVSLILRAFAEFLDVVMDIEENTRTG